MKVRICFGVCNNQRADFLGCECALRPVIPHHHNPPSTYNKEHAAKPGKKGLKWLKMGEIGWQFKCATSSMHKKRKKKLVMGQQTCEEGHNLGSNSCRPTRQWQRSQYRNSERASGAGYWTTAEATISMTPTSSRAV